MSQLPKQLCNALRSLSLFQDARDHFAEQARKINTYNENTQRGKQIGDSLDDIV